MSVRPPTLLLLALLLAPRGGDLSAQEPHLDPLVHLLLAPEAQVEVAAFMPEVPVEPRAEPPPALPFRTLVDLDWLDPVAGPRVGLVLDLADPGALEVVGRVGGEVGVVVGTIATARVPVARLQEVVAEPGIAAVEVSRPFDLQNDRGVEDMGVPELRTLADGEWGGIAGEGVIVGVVDTGLDYGHPDFRTADDRSRLLGLWRQGGGAPPGFSPPPGFNDGYLCPPETLHDRSCPQRDVAGHGTHVTGSAAGNGFASGGGIPVGQYAGVAPAADILVVNVLRPDGVISTTGIINGVVWIFEEAERLGRPAVVNISLGSTRGARDGTEGMERALDELSGAGRLVITSAGNSGDNPSTTPLLQRRFIHAQATPQTGATRSFGVRIPQYTPQGANHVGLDLWHGGADAFSIEVVRPDGTRLTAPPGQVSVDHSAAGRILVDNASQGPDPRNDDALVFIFLSDDGESGPPAAGEWRINVTPTSLSVGRVYHLWLWASSMNAWGEAGFDNRSNLTTPATAHRLISVGAHVTRICWPTAAGERCWRDLFGWAEEVGGIAFFSSVGPTRDGRIRPDLSAPGRMIMSALSGAATRTQEFIAPTGQHRVNHGTSMSAPHVSGMVALLLQFDPTLTPERVREIIRESARRDDFTRRSHVTGEGAGEPNNTWGYGKADARAALEAVGAFEDISVLVVEVARADPPELPRSRRGTRIPLLEVTLAAEGPEPVRLERLGFDVRGEDPQARIVLLRDGPDGPVVGSAPATLRPQEDTRVVVPLDLVIEPGTPLRLVMAVELSGEVPNLASFRAEYVPGETRARGEVSGRVSPVRQPTTPVVSRTVRTTVLEPGEALALSENPVRSGSVIFNFRLPPTVAAVYTVSGRRVIDLRPRIDREGRFEWDLTNEAGTPVAAGVYLVVFEIGGELERLRLMIVRPR